MITLSCGIKILAVCFIVSSQSTRVWQTDRRTDGRTDGPTDGRTDGQNYDSQDRASIAASRGKNWNGLMGGPLLVGGLGPGPSAPLIRPWTLRYVTV